MFTEKEASTAIQFMHTYTKSNNASFQSIPLPTLIEKMKEKSAWKKEALNSMILLDSPARKVMLAIINKGTEIISLQANDSISLHVLEGKLRLSIRKGSFTIHKGEVMILYEKTNFSFTSMTETTILLTVAS